MAGVYPATRFLDGQCEFPAEPDFARLASRGLDDLGQLFPGTSGDTAAEPAQQKWDGLHWPANLPPMHSCTHQMPSSQMISSSGMRISGQQLAAQLLDEAEPLDEKSSSLESQQVHFNLPAQQQLLHHQSDNSMDYSDFDASDDLDDEEEYINSRGRIVRRPASAGRAYAQAGRKPIRKGGKEKKKVGRPIAYKGDPNAPELTEAERRRIKRRIANRESARRVRHKRMELLDELQGKMEVMQGHNADLQQRAMQAEAQKTVLTQQLDELHNKWQGVVAKNTAMQQEITGLRQSLQVKMVALELELDKKDTGLQGSVPPSAPVTTGASSQPFAAAVHASAPFNTCDHEVPDKMTLCETFPSANMDDMPSRLDSLELLSAMFPMGAEMNVLKG